MKSAEKIALLSKKVEMLRIDFHVAYRHSKFSHRIRLRNLRYAFHNFL
jgi:hypothetical protein